MAFKVGIDIEFNCGFLEHSSDSDGSTILPPPYEVQLHPDYIKGLDVLQDARRVIFTDTDKSFICGDTWYHTHRFEIQNTDHTHGASKHALLVRSASEKEMMEKFILSFLPSPVERGVFIELTSAYSWLGLPEGYVITYPDRPITPKTKQIKDDIK